MSHTVSAGGDEGNRTPNPRLAKAVLCQLSYVPMLSEDVTRPRWAGAHQAQLLVASCQRSLSERDARTFENTSAPAAIAATTAMIFFTGSRPACPGDG